jgi:hypothetical protein
VPLRGGNLEELSADGTGGPAAPVQVGGCIYGAWSDRPVMVRLCRGGAPAQTIQLGTSGLASERLEFRVNYDLVVLNSLTTGGLFTFDRSGENLGHWENVRPPQPDDQQHPDNDSPDQRPPQQNTPPVARDDKYGARPGQATLLPVLENDGDPDGDFIVISAVTPVGNGARLSVVANGQALQLVLPPDAAGNVLFSYTINDGRGGEATAKVTVTVRPQSENYEPAPVSQPRAATVEQGGTVIFHVLTDWRDGDGDPLVLLQATTDAPDEVRSTPDGFITFVDANVRSGKKTVHVRISDGHGDPVSGTVTVNVLGHGVPSPPQPRDDRVVGFVGQPLTIEPLLNDIDANVTAPDSAGPLRLSNVSSPPAGLTILGRDFENGKIIVRAEAPRTYYLTYEVTQGTDPPQAARIRIDIQPATSNNPPIAVADAVLLHGTSPSIVDVLANDTDADGDVLVVTSVSVPEKSGLIVSVLDHRWLRVVAPQSEFSSTEPITYTVSDGFSSDVGVVTVSRVLDTATQPPSPRDDVATVRAGDVVTIDVLANDVDPQGGLLTLGPDVIPDGDPKGHWYVAGGTVRYQAPATPGTVTAHYKVTNPEGREADARITVTITPADPEHDQAPRPNTLQARVFAGTVTRIHIPLSGVDVDGDSVVLLGANVAPSHGRIIGQGIDYLDYEAYQGQGGTDTFTYLVRDPFGQTGTGTVRVGIVPRPMEDSAPVAVDDEYEVAPGATVNAPVLANDSDVDGDPLQVEPLSVVDPTAGDRAKVVGNRIVVTAPTTPGDAVSVQYAVTDGRGLRSFATLRVVAKEGADVPPTAEDDWVTHFPAGATSVDVAVLDNDDDVDGPRSALKVEPIPDDSGLASVWVPGLNVLRVTLGDRPRQVAYKLTDAGGASAIAFVHVPAAGDQAPYVRDDAPDISITGGTQQEIDLTRYIVDAEGQPIRVTRAAGVSASPQPGLTVVDGSIKETSLTLRADSAYVGPATLVVEVTDGAGTNDGHRASLTLNVTVTPANGRHPTIACPPIEPRAGAPAIVVDLRTCVLGLTPLQREALDFTNPSGYPDGVSGERDGSKLRISARQDARPGASGTLHFTIGGPWGDIDAAMTVRVQAAALARANPDEIDRAQAGQAVTIDVTANDTNPFPGQPLRVLGVRVLEGGVTASVESDARTIRIQPASDFHGVAILNYDLQDALNQPDREVEGRITVHVVAKPDPPSAPREVSVGAGRAVVTWTAPESNGAEIDQYQVQDQTGATYDCGTLTTCELTGLHNGTGYVFKVQARNVVGWSELSPASVTITPDQRPDQPAAPTTQFGDGQITVHWTPPNSPGTPIRGYTIERSPGGPGSSQQVLAGTTSITFSGLTNGASYTFRVQAYNGAAAPSDWSPWSAPEVPAGKPAAPGAPTAAGVNDGIGQQMTVQWSAPNDNGASITRYTLTVVRAGTVVGTVPTAGDVTSATVDVDNGVQYTFRVTATNKAGDSPPSATSAATVAHGKPDQITSFTVADHDSSNHGFDGRVQYSLTPPNDNGMAISRYDFDVNGDGSVDYNSSAASGYVTGLTNGTNYQVRVRACNDVCGLWSVASPTVNPYGQPAAPAVSATVNGQTSITFSWTPPAPNGRALQNLHYKVDGGAETVLSPVAGNTTVSGLSPGSTHNISVWVVDVTGWQGSTATKSATTQSPPASLQVSRGSLRTPLDSQCMNTSCGWVYLVMDNFSPNTTYTVTLFDNRTGQWGQFTETTNGSGHWAGQTNWFYGFQGAQVWVTAGGVTSPHFTWPP